MTTPRPARRSRKNTSELLIESAELLFSAKGINGVSLQDISTKAGLANKFSVQYHFGGREELVRQVYERRLPKLDARRAELMAEVRRGDRLNDTAALFEVIVRPIAEVFEQGEYTYAAFLLSMYENDRSSALVPRYHELVPFTLYVYDLLHQTLPDVPNEVFLRRHHSAMLVFLDLLARIDAEELVMTTEQAIEEATTMGVAILRAPFAPN